MEMTPSLVFFGSDQYSAAVLSDLLLEPALSLIGVVTDRDQTPVGTLAKKHHLPLYLYPATPHEIPQETIGLCASFDHLLPESVIRLFGGRLYNLHPSLLPQYRNVSPVQYALALGDRKTGITLFRLSKGIDNGEIIAQAEVHISAEDTTPTLTSRLFALGVDLFLRSDLPAQAGLVDCQPNQKPTKKPTRSDLEVTTPLIFTKRLTRDSGFLEWSVFTTLLAGQTPPATKKTNNSLLRLRLTHRPQGNVLADLLRALTPWPGVWTTAPTQKGDLRLALTSVLPTVTVKLAGKPKPISWSDFTKYYL